MGITIIFIAHDLSVVRHVCDTIAVMYLGKIVETGVWDKLYDNPQHPYTKMLFSAIPIPDPELDKQRSIELLKGEIPSVLNVPKGCAFSTRCPYAMDVCKTETPGLAEVEPNHLCACFLKQKA